MQKFGLAEWLLNPTNCMSLISSHLADTPTFYQTLAGVTHLSEQARVFFNIAKFITFLLFAVPREQFFVVKSLLEKMSSRFIYLAKVLI
jgi:hypothetical protein